MQPDGSLSFNAKKSLTFVWVSLHLFYILKNE